MNAYRHISAAEEFRQLERLRENMRHNEASAHYPYQRPQQGPLPTNHIGRYALRYYCPIIAKEPYFTIPQSRADHQHATAAINECRDA
jgi:hypothetical protein